jgi:CheY-like chemotaxis protein
MPEPIRILVVDDDFATLDFLRSILELSQEDFEVLGVPSAEEGLLALRHTTFHLLVADIRLPGITGLQMTQKAREIYPGIPVILITGYDLEDFAQELADLDIVDTFTKPLDAEDFLAAVYGALDKLPQSWPLDSQEITSLNYPTVPVGIRRRLESLLDDTGAKQIILANVSGEILFNTRGESDQEIRELVAASAFSIDSSFHLSDRLGAGEPQAIQFLVGQENDLYCANIDRQHFLVITFDARFRRGRIGTVWVFTRRAIKDLRLRLADSISPEGQVLATPEVSGDVLLPEPLPDPVDPYPEEVDVAVPSPEDEVREDDAVVLTTPEPVIQETETEGDSAAPGQLLAMEKLLDNMLSEASANRQQNVDLDAYWKEAFDSDGVGDFATSGITLEEAKNMGLLDIEFNTEEE